MIEETFVKIDEQYSQGAVLDEYNNKYSICSANEGKDEKIYLQWAFPQNRDKEPQPKAIPWKVSLGDRSQAVKTLEYFLKVLKGSKQGDFESEHRPLDNTQPAIDEEEMPF